MADEPMTHRFRDGSLATHARSKVTWARISRTGRVHRIVGVIVRWNFMGGTREAPDVTFVTMCGPQRHNVLPAPCHDPMDRCARCDGAAARQGVSWPTALDFAHG